jgi:hypothetical protein
MVKRLVVRRRLRSGRGRAIVEMPQSPNITISGGMTPRQDYAQCGARRYAVCAQRVEAFQCSGLSYRFDFPADQRIVIENMLDANSVQ